MIADDRNPHLLWLIGLRNGQIYPDTYSFHVSYQESGDAAYKLESPEPDTASYITAFDTRTGLFSDPLMTDECAHVEARGDYLYLTGHTFRRVAKSNWKAVIKPGLTAGTDKETTKR